MQAMVRSVFILALALGTAALSMPRGPAGAVGLAAVSAGAAHTCALTTAGGVKCWGENWSGEVGDGTSGNFRATPVDVAGLAGGVDAAGAGGSFSCALLATGSAKCWGINHFGLLGDGTTMDSSVPVDVVGLNDGAAAIAVGGQHACALMIDGSVKCWGRNYAGQLGNGAGGDEFDLSATPVDVCADASCDTKLTDAVALASGGSHSCALTMSGGVKCWGSNISGQLGDATTDDRLTPGDVVGLPTTVAMISAGEHHTCAVRLEGTVLCWGVNHGGTPGTEGLEACYPYGSPCATVPVEVPGLGSDVVSVAAGGRHTCGLTARGGVKCWGENFQGQLGDGTVMTRSAPVDVAGLQNDAITITSGGSHTCATTSTRGAVCWGSDFSGQLGAGERCRNRCSVPVDVEGLGAKLPGNADCTGHTDSVDALVILQYEARLVSSLRCQELADVNRDGRVDAIDALLILQYVAGLLSDLPP